jgi:hypothetical protein
MGMRETPRSIRAYFIFTGVMATLAAFSAAASFLASPVHTISSMIAVVSIVAYAAELLLLGLRFPTLLHDRPKRLEQGVYTVLAFGAMNALSTYATVTPVILLFELAVPLYLLANVRRLAREAAAAPLAPDGAK